MSVEPGIIQSDPLVSVIIPAYNAARTLEETLMGASPQGATGIPFLSGRDMAPDAIMSSPASQPGFWGR